MRQPSSRLARSWAFAAAALLAAIPVAEGAGPYPAKPVRIVVPFGAGGIADLTARAVADRLGETLGQPVIIENHPGAGGVVAAQTVVRAAPDGYSVLLISNGTAVSAGLFKSLPYDTMKDLAPVSTIAAFDLVIVTKGDAPYATLPQALAYAREHPGRLNIGTINVGSTQNLAAELFKTRAGVDAQVVPFAGTPALIAALLGGSVDLAVEILGPVRPQVEAGKLRALAVMGRARSRYLANVPTAMESGVKDLDVASWNGLAVPAGTPRDVVLRLNREVNEALRTPRVQARMADLGVEARGSTPEAARALLESEIRRWSEVITRAGIPRQ
jgi:tripartite-type tricarboxylate transporter receptor subunit TctC